jgi:bifunctional NMN adenylyltransferase/nudix hydrolase
MAQNRAFDFLVFIGRFQPFHLGHKAVIDQALKQANRVVVLVGSAKGPRTLRNPFTFTERSDMIRLAYDARPADQSRLHVTPLLDYLYADQHWIRSVQMSVRGIVCQYETGTPRIGLIGHEKDHTGYYLRMFPQWKSVAVENFRGLDATHIRHELFAGALSAQAKAVLPASTAEIIQDFCNGPEYRNLKAEAEFVADHRRRRKREDGHPVIDHTVDAVVIQSGNVLLVRRRKAPGKGLLALPGGYIGEHEKLRDAMLRELREETRIALPDQILSRNIKTQRTFDDPNRSVRGRIITTAFLIELEGRERLPDVHGADDADLALWVPLAQLDRDRLFEDHGSIIDVMLGYTE